MGTHTTIRNVVITERRWLSDLTFELVIQRPQNFDFYPGQRIRIVHAAGERDYSLASGVDAKELVLCIRLVDQGNVSEVLSTCDLPAEIPIKGPYGYFTFKPSTRQAIFAATGTGIAPFSSMVRSGIGGFVFLHGVRQSADLYYRNLFQTAAITYMACLSRVDQESDAFFHGHVTEYLQKHLPLGSYDFYLCGNRGMIRDVTRLVDQRFPGSLVYMEMFY